MEYGFLGAASSAASVGGGIVNSFNSGNRTRCVRITPKYSGGLPSGNHISTRKYLVRM